MGLANQFYLYLHLQPAPHVPRLQLELPQLLHLFEEVAVLVLFGVEFESLPLYTLLHLLLLLDGEGAGRVLTFEFAEGRLVFDDGPDHSVCLHGLLLASCLQGINALFQISKTGRYFREDALFGSLDFQVIGGVVGEEGGLYTRIASLRPRRY